MSKVIFSSQYEIFPDKRNEYLEIVKELKSIIAAEGLESYSVFEKKNKENNFEEIYIFSSEEAFEKFDDIENERIDLLLTKLADLIKEHSTEYKTLIEVSE